MDDTIVTLVTAIESVSHLAMIELNPEDQHPAVVGVVTLSTVLCHYLRSGVLDKDDQRMVLVAKSLLTRKEEGH